MAIISFALIKNINRRGYKLIFKRRWIKSVFYNIWKQHRWWGRCCFWWIPILLLLESHLRL